VIFAIYFVMFGHFMTICFAYSVMDFLTMEDDDCMKLMQQWLCVSYLNVEAIRRVHAFGQFRANGDKNFIFSFRQPTLLLKFTVGLNWCVLVPFFAVWTGYGTLWLKQTLAQHPEYIFAGAPPVLVVVWQVLSYLGLFMYVLCFGNSCLNEVRFVWAERSIRAVETDASVARWGHVRPSSSARNPTLKGLQPKRILELPEEEIHNKEGVNSDEPCSICLQEFNEGDEVRRLPGCKHTFHKCCVDLWLLQQAHCPLCKGKVE
jgi:hypothetical protein